jgi:hypothetical protein
MATLPVSWPAAIGVEQPVLEIDGAAASGFLCHLPSAVARRSASAFNGPSAIQRIRMIPGERKDQYRRKFLRDTGSVAPARVSVLNTE